MDTVKKDRNLVIKLISSISLPIGILILMTMMVIPLPVFLLDVFFTSNILISLIVLMVALQTFKPLDFSSFPTVLLFATVLRLGLNVASTRIVLSQGHTGTDAAGNVITYADPDPASGINHNNQSCPLEFEEQAFV